MNEFLPDKKLNYIFLGIVIVGVGIGLSLFRWQVLEHNKFVSLANERSIVKEVEGLRGRIVAEDGTVLAYSKKVYDIYLSKKEIEDAHNRKENDSYKQDKYELFDALDKVLDKKRGYTEEKVDESSNIYFKLADNVDKETSDAIISLKVGKENEKPAIGVHIEEDEERIYPNKELASHILGFVGKDDYGNNIGRNGIEEYWNGDLVPKKGYVEEEIDNRGNRILTSDFDPVYSKDGRDIILTIDLNIQGVLEKKLEEGVAKYEAKTGAAVIMDPKNGHILAMASYPTYDPNKYFEVEDVNDLTNKVISNIYENGSVWKAFTASAAINEGAFEPDSVVFKSHPGCVDVIAGKKICTAFRNAVNKPTTLTGVLETSDNIGSYYIAKKIGAETLYNYLKAFGIGSYTNIGLANEQTDILRDYRKWNELDLAVTSFGQSEASTLLQTVSGFSAIANDGRRMQPRIVAKVIDGDREIKFDDKLVEKVIDKETSQKMTNALVDTFNAQGGDYIWRDLDKYRIAGKTGTAQIPKKDGPGYLEDATNVTVIGYDASDSKNFVMGITLSQPKEKTFSFQSAFPLWVETFKELHGYLEVVPSK